MHPPLASLTSGAIGTTVALDAVSLLPGRPPRRCSMRRGSLRVRLGWASWRTSVPPSPV
ncbi:rieske domain protein [Mycobacterium xenopi 3993]|nr:rieske domain protein [Mycobacterium xenopi 3993]